MVEPKDWALLDETRGDVAGPLQPDRMGGPNSSHRSKSDLGARVGGMVNRCRAKEGQMVKRSSSRIISSLSLLRKVRRRMSLRESGP